MENKNINNLSDDLFELVEYKHEEEKFVSYEKYSYWQSTFKTFFKSKLNVTVLIIIVLFVLMSFLYPLISDIDPYKLGETFMDYNLKPSADHLFGTDAIGRDIFARAWYGARISLLLAFIIAASDMFFGVIMGSLWGYIKKMDRFMTEFYNIIMNIPQTVYLIILAYVLRPGFWTIVIALASRGWLSIAKFIRNKVIVIRDSEYNIASQCLGTPISRIVRKNIIPYLVSIVIMETALSIPYVIGSEVFLGYIGLGMPSTEISLGVLVNDSIDVFTNYPYQLLFPCLIVATITISFYILGNKFADASDPKNHR